MTIMTSWSRLDVPRAPREDHLSDSLVLLKHGADAALATTKTVDDVALSVAAGSTALSIARQSGRNAMVELLTKRRRRRKKGKSGSSAR